MTTSSDTGSFQRLAHPAARGPVGVPDSCNRTAHPAYWQKALTRARFMFDWKEVAIRKRNIAAIELTLEILRRGRPGRVSVRMSDEPNNP